MNKKPKNTQRAFYARWNQRDMVLELCRLNKILVDCLKVIKKK